MEKIAGPHWLWMDGNIQDFLNLKRDLLVNCTVYGSSESNWRRIRKIWPCSTQAFDLDNIESHTQNIQMSEKTKLIFPTCLLKNADFNKTYSRVKTKFN